MNHPIARSFGRAAASYDAHSAPQRHAARRLAELIAAEILPESPRVLEIGCGTGHLTQLLARRVPQGDFLYVTGAAGDGIPCGRGVAGAVPRDTATHNFLCSDIAPAMVAICRARLPDLRYVVMDGERPAVGAGFDLVCANLAAQWFHDLPAALARLAALLAPGGLLAISTLGAESFREWRAVHAALGFSAGTPPFSDAATLRAAFPAGALTIDEEIYVDRAETALDLPRRLRAIGAATPAPGHRPLKAGQLRRVLRALGPEPAFTYQLFYACFRKTTA
ncbi:MAG: methyltransferase domain-containing protein [Sulfurisoma sp.]|nr:methyltransferase domain-containing protein [Sulfurisoma sp.]